jgi:hypothetical protein
MAQCGGLEDEIKLQAGGSAVGRGSAAEDVGGVRVCFGEERRISDRGNDVGGEARMDGWRGEEEMMVMERRWNGVLVPRQI